MNTEESIMEYPIETTNNNTNTNTNTDTNTPINYENIPSWEGISASNTSLSFDGGSMHAPFMDNIDRGIDSDDLFTENASFLKDFIENKDRLKESIQKINIDTLYDEVDYKNEEIDDITNKIDKLVKEFITVQNDFNKADDVLKSEIKRADVNIQKLNDFINFLNKMNNTTDDICEIQGIIDTIKDLSNKISDTKSIQGAKKKFAEEKLKMKKFIYMIQKLNKWNTTNLCIICQENKVDHFINPCGHTFCKECLVRNFKVKDITNYDFYTGLNNKKCPVCRSCSGPVISIKPLYFL